MSNLIESGIMLGQKSTEIVRDPILAEIDESLIDTVEESLLEGTGLIVGEITFSKVVSAEVTLPNGISGIVTELLNDEITAIAAINGATQAHVEYQEELARLSGFGNPQTATAVITESRKPEVLAHLGVLRRVKEGRYNGMSDEIDRRARWHIGSFIQSADSAHREVLPVLATTVFDSKTTTVSK